MLKNSIQKKKIKILPEIRIKRFISTSDGITILALIITIIVLIILSGITIVGLTGEEGLIKNVQKSKNDTEIANEKEIVEVSTTQSMGDNSRGNIIQNELQNKINLNTNDDNRAEVIDNGNTLIVKFIKSNRYYEVDRNGNVSEPIIITNDEYAGDLTKGNQCDGTQEKPYKISSIEDLVAFSQNVNNGNNYDDKYIILTKTLDFKSIFSYNDYTTTKYGDLNQDGQIEDIKTELTKTDDGCIGFTPIGQNKNDNAFFSGIFDGKGNEINNIYINSKSSAGLFDVATRGFEIINLGISGNINAQGGPAGGILARTINMDEQKQIILNCYNKCDVSANFLSGGYQGVGGIVGGGQYVAINLDIINCYNTGNITLKSGSENCIGAGGIIGEFRGDDATLNVSNCYNIGKITSVSKAGGILGTIWAEGTSRIENCYNIGEILGSTRYNIAHANLIENCYYKKTSYNGADSASTISFNNIKEENIAQKLNNYITENLKQDVWKYWKYDEEENLIFVEEN